MQLRFTCVAVIAFIKIASVGFGQEFPSIGVYGIGVPPGTGPGMSGAGAKLVISEPLPADAQALMTGFDREAAAIREKAEQEVQIKRRSLIAALKVLQDVYTRDAKLDEAVAIRDVIRQLSVAHLKPLPDPGNLTQYGNRIGESFYFEVVGATGYSVWGTEVYTYDSYLATASVHSGVLKDGQRGIVKVTMLNSPNPHRGSMQNGVTTSNWGPYSASFTVERPNVDNVPALKTKPAEPEL